MKKEYDFSKGKRVDPSKVDPSPKLMISLRLEPHVLSALKDEAEGLGVGYQTLIGTILKKHLEPSLESLEERLLNRVLSRLEKAGVMKGLKDKTKKKKTA